MLRGNSLVERLEREIEREKIRQLRHETYRGDLLQLLQDALDQIRRQM